MLSLLSNVLSGFSASVDSADPGGGSGEFLWSGIKVLKLIIFLLFSFGGAFSLCRLGLLNVAGRYCFSCLGLYWLRFWDLDIGNNCSRGSVWCNFSGICWLSSIRFLFFLWCTLGRCSTSSSLVFTSEVFFHSSILLINFILSLLVESDSELIVDERNDHIIMEWDHI